MSLIETCFCSGLYGMCFFKRSGAKIISWHGLRSFNVKCDQYLQGHDHGQSRVVTDHWSGTNSWQLSRLARNVKKFNATYRLFILY